MRKRAREAKAAEAALTEAQGEHERCEAEVCAIAKEVQQRAEGMRKRKRELEGVGHGVAQPTADNLTAAATTTPTITGQQRRPHMRRRPSGVP